MIPETFFAWKRVSDGTIAQGMVAGSPEELFLSSGFGPVDTDKPIKGFLAVQVCRDPAGCLIEDENPPGVELKSP